MTNDTQTKKDVWTSNTSAMENKDKNLESLLDVYTPNLISNFLGESPFWVPETESVCWIDILKGTFNRWNIKNSHHSRETEFKTEFKTEFETEFKTEFKTDFKTEFKTEFETEFETWNLKQPLGCAVPVNDEPHVVLIASLKGIGLYDLRARTWTHNYGNPEYKRLTNRWNDGKCGPDGRFWVGSMNHIDTQESLARGERDGALYVLNGRDNKPRFHKEKDYVGISNGLAWSSDGLRMYYIDTPKHAVQEYLYSSETKHIKLLKPDCIVIAPGDGDPDGCAMDADDSLWIAMWGGGSINQYSTQSGVLLSRIAIADKYPTSLAWFGQDLDRLFITTAQGDSLTEIIDGKEEPIPCSGKICSGKSYVIDFKKTGIRGIPVSGFEIENFED